MITTSTPALDFTGKQTKGTGENQLPDFDTPAISTINNILNYSKSLEIKKSRFVSEFEVVKS